MLRVYVIQYGLCILATCKRKGRYKKMRRETRVIPYGNKNYTLYRSYPNVEYIDKLSKKLVVSKKDIESVKSQLSYCWLDDDYLFMVALDILNMESVKPKRIYEQARYISDDVRNIEYMTSDMYDVRVKPSVDEIFHMLLKDVKTYVFHR